MGMADAITPTDEERATMWPPELRERLDWMLAEVNELEVVNDQTELRREAVSQRAEEIVAAVRTTREELTLRDVGLTQVSGGLDRLSNLLGRFRGRLGLGQLEDNSDGNSSEDASATNGDGGSEASQQSEDNGPKD